MRTDRTQSMVVPRSPGGSIFILVAVFALSCGGAMIASYGGERQFSYGTALTAESDSRQKDNAGRRTPSVKHPESDRIRATVNGKPIRGGDFLPMEDERIDRLRLENPERYQNLLEREVERELAFQAASKKGIRLSKRQELKLDNIRSRRRHDASVVDPIGDQDKIVAMEVRESQARMLENALLNERGVLPPYVTDAQVREYYESHRDEIGILPFEGTRGSEDAWQGLSILIRRKLTSNLRTKYDQERKALVADLKREADIEVSSEP